VQSFGVTDGEDAWLENTSVPPEACPVRPLSPVALMRRSRRRFVRLAVQGLSAHLPAGSARSHLDQPRKALRPGKTSASTPTPKSAIAVVSVPSLARARTAGMGGGSGHAQKKVRCRSLVTTQLFSLLSVGLTDAAALDAVLHARATFAGCDRPRVVGRSGPHADLLNSPPAKLEQARKTVPDRRGRRPNKYPRTRCSALPDRRQV